MDVIKLYKLGAFITFPRHHARFLRNMCGKGNAGDLFPAVKVHLYYHCLHIPYNARVYQHCLRKKCEQTLLYDRSHITHSCRFMDVENLFHLQKIQNYIKKKKNRKWHVLYILSSDKILILKTTKYRIIILKTTKHSLCQFIFNLN